MILTFGKHKGKDLEDFMFNIPEISKDAYYCKWLIQNEVLTGNLRKEFKYQLTKRNMTIKDYIAYLDMKILNYRRWRWRNISNSNRTSCSSSYEDAFYGYAYDYPEYY